MAIDIEREALLARWRSMDANAAAEVLRTTTWSHLTGDHEPPALASEPIANWDDEAESAPSMTTTRRAAVVASRLMTHDPRFARQLQRLSAEPFSEDFAEFLNLLIESAAEAGAAYVRHFDSDPPLPLDRVVRATGGLLGIDVLPDPEFVLIRSESDPIAIRSSRGVREGPRE